MSIGKQMKTIREELGKTQKQMAKIIKVSEMQYNRYENGKATPSFKVLVRFASSFNKTLHIYPHNQ